MAIKITIESFLAVLRKSTLIEPERLDECVPAIRAATDGEFDAAALAQGLVDRQLLTAWQADKLLQGKHRGFFIGKYRLLSLLGKGGMSSVYLAEHIVMRRRCAIKVLPHKRVHDSSYLERFHREAQAVAALDHPNIVRAYDVDFEVDHDAEIHFLVMEYVHGASLQDLVTQKGPLGETKAADYIRQTAEGLSHAHAAGMVHRDVKPGNLLVDSRGVVRILDLGLARFFNETEENPLTIRHDERVLGTADYLSPEQALNSHQVDVRADIYSLGCTFFYLLTGHPPYREETLAQRLMSHQTKPLPSILDDRPDVCPDLVEIVETMTQKAIDDRYESMQGVVEALEAWTQKHNTSDTWAPGPDDEGVSLSDSTDSRIGRGSSIDGEDAVSPAASAEPAADELASFLTQLDNPKVSEPRPTIVSGVEDDTATDHAESLAKPESSPEPKAPLGRASKPAPEPIEPKISESSAPRKKKPALDRRLVIAGGGVLFVIAAGFAVSGLLSSDDAGDDGTGGTQTQSSDEGDQSEVVQRELVVRPTGGDFATIGEALTYARKHKEALTQVGQRSSLTIKVTGGHEYAERIQIDNSGEQYPDGLRIISDGSQAAILAPEGAEPTIDVAGDLEWLRIEGFELRSSSQPVSIRLRGFLAGMQLSKLVVTGFSTAAIEILGASGLGNYGGEVRLESITARSISPDAVACRFAEGSDGTAKRIQLRNCRFVGPAAAGIDFAAGASFVTVDRCAFMAADAGIRFAGGTLCRDIVIQQNTFFRCPKGIVFRGQSSEESANFGFFRNLFAQVDVTEGIVEAEFDESKFRMALSHESHGGIRENFSDRTPESALVGEFRLLEDGGGGRVPAIQFLSTDPGEPDFLRPSAPIGAPPYPETNGLQSFIGAFSP